jgi:hypothetical protein
MGGDKKDRIRALTPWLSSLFDMRAVRDRGFALPQWGMIPKHLASLKSCCRLAQLERTSGRGKRMSDEYVSRPFGEERLIGCRLSV